MSEKEKLLDRLYSESETITALREYERANPYPAFDGTARACPECGEHQSNVRAVFCPHCFVEGHRKVYRTRRQILWMKGQAEAIGATEKALSYQKIAETL